jgi:plastocyanin
VIELSRARQLLKLALIVVLACGCVTADGASAPPATPALELTVGSAGGEAMAFVPDVVRAPSGTRVRITFRNESSQPHNLTFPTPISAASMTIVEPGMSDAVDVLTPGPGSYRFVCTIHVGMSGTLTVT